MELPAHQRFHAGFYLSENTRAIAVLSGFCAQHCHIYVKQPVPIWHAACHWLDISTAGFRFSVCVPGAILKNRLSNEAETGGKIRFSGAQALASLSTAATDNRTSGLGCHASAKAMLAGTANPAGFERKTHVLLLGSKRLRIVGSRVLLSSMMTFSEYST